MSEQPDRARTDREVDPRTGKAAAALRIQHQTSWVDLQIRKAQERGDFENLPGAGKPLDQLIGRGDDPDWWVKRLIEREKITGVLPPALQLRKDDAALADHLDALSAESDVRREVTEFNARIKHALLTNLGGPPVITERRDVEAEVEAWRARRRARALEQAESRRAEADAAPEPRRRWWSRARRAG
ncbi:DUF1992 domain-containing protein [Nocardioides sp. CFH 31398]|uniref:DnaJ family domain-containing protein n=1 Tax=Nocardioides sp. CFH 31398 TaxID=2919579 RepID=UPI001F0663ED|nr:DUF1992 domain-containing protein [Nocardioides sp. CFH 31398]MCH1865007.1 DUF1992 domain-containing protein [Nocardioides sp. CFH 31398]